MTTGERIKALRTGMGLSQEELGAMVGVQKAAIHKYETGRIVNFKRDVLEKLAEALNTTEGYLLGLEPSQPTDAEIKFALFGDAQVDDALYEEVRAFARFAQDRKKKKE